jgi:hypothetical protein
MTSPVSLIWNDWYSSLAESRGYIVVGVGDLAVITICTKIIKAGEKEDVQCYH